MAQEQAVQTSLVFFGTPSFAAVILDALHHDSRLRIQAVVTQPDRPCGRGRACKPSAVKERALALGLPVIQPETLKSQQAVSELQSHRADFFVVAAYGLLLPKNVLDLPRHGCLNVHASLLPRHRGASPIQAALLNGEKVTGVTIMRMVQALDAGPMLLQRAMAIGPEDTARTVHDQLAEMGGRMIVEAIHGLLQGKLAYIEQDHALATYAPKLSKKQGLISWDRPAMEVHNHVRAMHPWPGAYFFLPWPGKTPRKITVHPGAVGDPLQAPAPPGTFLGMQSGRLAVACADRAYLINSVHPSDANPMESQAFFCGYLQSLAAGDVICS